MALFNQKSQASMLSEQYWASQRLAFTWSLRQQSGLQSGCAASNSEHWALATHLGPIWEKPGSSSSAAAGICFRWVMPVVNLRVLPWQLAPKPWMINWSIQRKQQQISMLSISECCLGSLHPSNLMINDKRICMEVQTPKPVVWLLSVVRGWKIARKWFE